MISTTIWGRLKIKLKMNEYPAPCLLESEDLPPPLLDLSQSFDCNPTATTTATLP